MKTRTAKLFETLEDRRLFSVADFTIDPNASRIAISGMIDNHPILEQSAGSLTAWLSGTVRADVVAGSIRLTGGSSITPLEQYYFARPYRTTASLAGKVENVNLLGAHTDAFFALRGAAFDVTSPTLTIANGDFASGQVSTVGTAGTLDFEAGSFVGGVSLTERSIVSPTMLPSSLSSVRGQTRLTLQVDFMMNQDVPGNGTATIHVVGSIVANARLLGGVAGNVYHDVNDNNLRDEGAVSTPAGAFKVYADVNRNSRFDSDEPSATPDARGDYQMEYVPLGQQTIRLQAPAGYRQNLASLQRSEVNVIGNGNVTGQNFMVTRRSMISGVAWADADRDGRIDATETRWAGRRVFSDLDGNGIYTAGEPSTITNAKGAYTLRNLNFGTHRIRVELPKGNIVTTPATGYATVSFLKPQAALSVNLGTGLGTSPILPLPKLVLK
jgi:hypothetical protein